MNSILRRWCPSWAHLQKPSLHAARNVVSTGILMVRSPDPQFLTCIRGTDTVIGNWIASTPIPEQSLESREMRLEGRDQEILVAFARKVLRWLPEERPSAGELLAQDDEFLTQFMAEMESGGI
jgi:hypothetical protein